MPHSSIAQRLCTSLHHSTDQAGSPVDIWIASNSSSWSRAGSYSTQDSRTWLGFLIELLKAREWWHRNWMLLFGVGLLDHASPIPISLLLWKCTSGKGFTTFVFADLQPLLVRQCSDAGQCLPQEAGGPEVAQHGKPQLYTQVHQAMEWREVHAGHNKKGVWRE